MMLVYALIVSRVETAIPCWLGRHGLLPTWLQNVLNAAARVITGTRKFDRDLSNLLHSKLH